MAQNKKIVSSRFPYLPIQITTNRTISIKALLDTGFDGEVILPAEIVTNGELPNWYVECKLADDSVVEVPAFFCSVKLGNKRLNDIVLLIMGDEPIIGRELIKHSKITLYYGKKIILEE